MALTPNAAARKDAATAQSTEMQHRHFAVIAATIKNMNTVHSGEHGFVDVREDAARHFANALAHTNPRFDRQRFLKACGF